MSKACEGLESCDISPVRHKMKHTSTPMRTRRKTSRREQGVDVHTTNACSTSTAHLSPRLSRSTQNSPRFKSPSHFSSPSCSIPSSQDQPDVIWDYNSPKLPKSGKKRELKITVQELLENLSQCQSTECNSQSGTYMKLLENWMSKPSEATVKKTLDNKKQLKKRSRQRIEELKNFIESIQRPKTDIDSASSTRQEEHSECEQETGDKVEINAAESNINLKDSFLEGGSTDDSSEELWGDMDNSFIVKATQELDKISVITTTTTTNQLDEIISTIPLTVPSSKCSKSQSPAIIKEKHCEQHNDFLLQLSNIDWDLDDDDDDEWDKGFLLEDDDLSLIPEDVLSGESIKQKEEKENVPQKCTTPVQNPKLFENELVNVNIGKNAKKNSGTSCNLRETEFSVMAKVVPTIELDNSFEDDSFEDESILCQPEVLSRIDEVESMLSQPKCTPEEIRKKKEEAINRRKNMHLRKKNQHL